MAAILGLQQRLFSKFRITTNGGQCYLAEIVQRIAKMGIDVRSYAQKGENIVRSSCVGLNMCGCMSQRCFEIRNGSEEGRINLNEILLGNDVNLMDLLNNNRMKKSILHIAFLFTFFQVSGQKTYFKDYYDNVEIGRLNQIKKVDYWFYFENVIKRGRSLYKEQKCKWWIFTNLMRKSKKCEFDNGQMNGSLVYRSNQIIRAEKYIMGKKTKEWNLVTEFKRDNTINFL
jgi:hypothetical protein